MGSHAVPLVASSYPGNLYSTATEAQLRQEGCSPFPRGSGHELEPGPPNLLWEVCQLGAWIDAMGFHRTRLFLSADEDG